MFLGKNSMHEVCITKRKNLKHLRDMKLKDFVLFCKKLMANNAGILHTRAALKVDGLGARFGVDKTGRVFFESSNSGPVYEPGDFLKYTIKKYPSPRPEEIIIRAAQYDNLLLFFKEWEAMKYVPKNTKVVCEILWRYLDKNEWNAPTAKFVHTEYDRNLIGRILTIVPIRFENAETGEDITEESYRVMYDLVYHSNSYCMVVDPALKRVALDLQMIIEPVYLFTGDYMRVLDSRFKIDAPAKKELLETINQAKEKLERLLSDDRVFPGKYMLGPNVEGIVIMLDGENYKVTTPSFKEAMRHGKAV